MDRREILKTVGAVGLAAFVSDALAAREGHEHHAGHDHAKMKNPNGKLIASTSDCISKGQLCVDHCLMLLADGETEMAGCARSVHQMLALCGALQQLAGLNSGHLKPLAKVAMAACQNCEDECRKHEKDHAVCKDCGDACAACHKECKALSA
jgi:Cys-rich four helix bundle protein (predicted Tat secretion target)